VSQVLTAIEVFCSYAQSDEAWLLKWQKHLSLLQQQGLIKLWQKRRLVAGADWAKAIDTHLETASVILLLRSRRLSGFRLLFWRRDATCPPAARSG
jgi:hypothetical protein